MIITHVIVRSLNAPSGHNTVSNVVSIFFKSRSLSDYIGVL